MQNKISYVLSGKNEGFREIKKKFESGIKLRMNVYADGSQSISVCKAKKDGDIPQVVIDKICKKYNIDKKPHITQSEVYYVIKNKNTENANDDVKIDWFVENIQKIINIL